MKFVAAREFRVRPGEIWRLLEEEGQVVITSNGKPIAILTGVSADTLEETLRAIRQARATAALSKIRKEAREAHADRLADADVDREIQAARQARKR